MASRKPTDTVQVNLRLPEWLRLNVLRRSEKSGRSFNGELIHLIHEGMAKPKNAALIKEAADKASVSATSRVAEMIGLMIYPEGISRLAELVRAAMSDAPPAPRVEPTGTPRPQRHHRPPPSSAQEPLPPHYHDPKPRHEDER
jgi:hypothetical protein